jgi:hypothetical protein
VCVCVLEKPIKITLLQVCARRSGGGSDGMAGKLGPLRDREKLFAEKFSESVQASMQTNIVNVKTGVGNARRERIAARPASLSRHCR